MKDKTARVLAIIALVAMFIFVASLTAMLAIPEGALRRGFMYSAIAGGIITALLFVLIKADGRGFSMTRINNEIEMKKLEDENRALIEAERKRLQDEAGDVPDANEAGKAVDAPDANAAPEENGADGRENKTE